jgi:hypothetical protein
MKWDNREPCKTCPYRLDVPVGTWHKDEFLNLLKQDKNEMHGAVFQCHQDKQLPNKDRHPCIGWLLDQRSRNTPSIQLRLDLIRQDGAADCYNEMTDGGHKLYDSIEEMARVNIPAKRRRRSRDHG